MLVPIILLLSLPLGEELDYSQYLDVSPLDGGAACLLCGNVFTHTTNARRHVRTAHMGKPQACNICGKMLKNERTFKLHMKSTHPDNIRF